MYLSNIKLNNSVPKKLSVRLALSRIISWLPRIINERIKKKAEKLLKICLEILFEIIL